MGRTAPTLRAAMREEIHRLRKVATAIRDPELKKAMEDLLNHATELHDAYLRTDPPIDPMEAIILSMLTYLRKLVGDQESEKEK